MAMDEEDNTKQILGHMVEGDSGQDPAEDPCENATQHFGSMKVDTLLHS